MTGQLAISDSAPQRPRFVDAFVIFSVTVLSLAIGAWFLLRLELALWSGTVAALAIYTLLLALHLLVRRSFLFEPAPARPARGGWVSHAIARAEAHRLAMEGDELAGRTERDIAGPLLPEARPGAHAGAPEHGRQAEARDPFHFRPLREPSLPIAEPEPGPERELERGRPFPPEQYPSDPAQPGMSVEVIQDLIKKLADELNNPPPGDPPAGESPARQPEITRPRAPAHAQGMSPPAQPSLDAVRVGARSGAAQTPPALNPQLARIAEAIAAQRVEVLLEPIHALVEGRPRHVEVSMRLLTADGAALDNGELARAARGTGLMPRIDAARLMQATRVACRLGDRGRQGSVLALIDAASLVDESFLAAAAAPTVGDAASRLVLSFAQREVRAFSSAHAQALKMLASSGLRFALEEVADLDMDFAALKEMGIDFVKLDAPQFLDGLPAAGGRMPASDICRHLADYGLTLIVGRIEDEWLLARILGFGVLFGKGALFGEPRIVRDEGAAEPPMP